MFSQKSTNICPSLFSLYKIWMGINDKSPYEILGVGRYSTQKEIRKRYLELCKIYHPDVSKLKDTTASNLS
ncbi:unnamed protein product [Rhizopus microsporus]